MSILGSIVSAIFGHSAAATTASSSTTSAPGVSPPAASATSAPVKPGVSPAQTVDVAAIIDKAAAATGEKLDWRSSIVDLMKALGLDSSLAARKQLANELHYTGSTNDSATMNVWLHREVMAKLAANSGKLPADIRF